MVKAIIFDFWGTLVESGVWSPTKQVRAILNLDIPFSDFVVRLEKAMMTGNFNELREAFEAVGREFKVEILPEKMEQLIGMWNKSWMLAKPYPETAAILEELKSKYTLILVSNSDCFSVKKTLEKFAWAKYFQEIYISCDVGMIKTEKAFLQLLLEKNNLNPEDCLVVGDSIQSDILAAKQAGMHYVLVDRKNSRDFDPKISNLKELEKILG